MSWALDAIEREALRRARESMTESGVQVCGLSVAKILALRHFYKEVTGVYPEDYSAETILSTLRANVLKPKVLPSNNSPT